MPMWGPPTPPQQDTDVYIDQTLTFLYDINVMTESQLPPIYIKKESKRIRLDTGTLLDPRRSLKVHQRKDDSVYPPRSLFERPSPALVKMRRDIKLQKFRGIVRPPVPIPGIKLAISKPSIDPPIWHNWTIHEDMALLKVIQSFQGLSLNLMILSPGHTPNWDFVADYVNTVSVTYRSPKQCRHRYETVIIPREEGRQTFDSSSSARKKKNKSNSSLYKFSPQPKLSRTMRTSQQYIQDNNCSFAQAMVQRFDSLIGLATKQRMAVNKATLNNPLLKNAKLAGVLSECGIDLEHPVLPVEVAARRAERISREKKNMTPEQQLAVAQRYQILKSGQLASQLQSTVQATVAQVVTPTTTSIPTVATPPAQPQIVTQTTAVSAAVMTTVVSTPTTPPAALRTQRIIASSIQTPTVVSVSGLSPAQLQAATQRLIVSSTPAQAKTIVGTTAVQGKLSQAQLQMMRQVTLKQQQLRLQAAGGLPAAQAVKTATVTIAGGQTAVQVQFTQAQPRAQFIKQGTVTVGTKQGIGRPVTDAEMAHILKRQQQLQQQKALAAAAAAAAASGSAHTSTIQTLPSQVFAQAIQAGTSANLAKAVSNSGANTQTVTVTIPVSGVTIGGTGGVKATLTPGGIKTTTAQQTIRQLQINQQILAQNKKLVNPKIAGIAQMTGKGGVATQLIVGSKPLSTAMTMQHFQQVIRSPLAVQQGPVVLAKGPPRVIPVNTGGPGPKQTIQVVAASSQGLTTAIRPQSSSTLAGALAGLKVQSSASSQAQQALLSQVSAALQSQAVGMRQSSPVRIQTSTGTPLIAVTMQSPQQQQHGTGTQQGTSAGLDKIEQA